MARVSGMRARLSGVRQGWGGRRGISRRHIITSLILFALIAVPVVLAAVHRAFPATNVAMSAKNVWVTNAKDSRAGRLNSQIEELDASVSMDSKVLDVAQDGEHVFVYDRGAATLGRIDPNYSDIRERATIGGESQVAIGGSTLAVVDRPTGKLWTFNPDQPLAFDRATTPPRETLGKGAQVEVTASGTTLAISAESGELLRIPADGTEPTRSKLGESADALSDVELTAVGERGVVFDRAHQQIIVEGGARFALDAVGVHVQLTGPKRDAVLVATAKDLMEVSLSDGNIRHRAWPGDQGNSTDAKSVARPAVAGDCAYGAWRTTLTHVTMCGGGDPQPTRMQAKGDSGELVFRVNREVVVLNDTASGNVILPQKNLRFVENWQDTVPPEDKNGSDGNQEATEQSFEDTLAQRTNENHPPELVDDEVGVRPGADSYLPVLDNDSDMDGDLITITGIEGTIPAQVGSLQLADNGRALQFHAAPEASGQFSVQYRGTDGRPNGTGQARLTIKVIPHTEANKAPQMRHKSAISLEAGRQIRYNILPDWQDPESDPVYLVGAVAPSGLEANTTPDGQITVRATAADLGPKQVTYTVSDGRNEATGTLKVDVAAPDSLSPVATPDFARGLVDTPISLEPLVNDLSPSGQPLQLIDVAPLEGGLNGRVNPEQQTISLQTNRPGTYYLQYTAKAGSKETKGIARFDVLDKPKEPAKITPVRDIAYLRPGLTASVNALTNDQTTGTGVLSIQRVDVPDTALGAGIRTELLNNATVRVSSDQPISQPYTLGYTVTDGTTSAEGTIDVVPVAAPAEHHQPVVGNDSAVVRQGDYTTVDVLANDVHPDNVPMHIESGLTDVNIGDGFAFVGGGKVRVQAPTKPGAYSLGYIVTDDNGEQAHGKMQLTVIGGDKTLNDAPTPRDLTARVFEGATVRVNVPLTGIDANGDSGMLKGLTAQPRLGAIRESDEMSFLFEAFPGASGTDDLTYEIEDTFGARGTGHVKISVVKRPETAMSPVARDDLVEAKPGTTVAIPVLDNDSDPSGYPLHVDKDLSKIDPALQAELDGQVLIVHVPSKGDYVTLPYAVTNGHGGRDDAYAHIRITQNPKPRSPSALDHVVKLSSFEGVDSVDVMLLDGAVNPNGKSTDLEVTAAGSATNLAELVNGNAYRVRLTDHRQVFAYTVTDPTTKRSASAFVMVPARPSAEAQQVRKPPFLKPERSREMTNKNEAKQWALADLVAAPSGLPVKLERPETAWAENGSGTQVALSETTVQFVPKPGYSGPASITFHVTDAQSPNDPNAGHATIRLPISVGDPNRVETPPVFAAPNHFDVAVGRTRELNLTELIGHPNPEMKSKVTFSGLAGATADVGANLDGTTLSVAVPRSAKVGAVVPLTFNFALGEIVQKATIKVIVTATDAEPMRRVGDLTRRVQSGTGPATVDVRAAIFNPFPDAALDITDAKVVSSNKNAVTLNVADGKITALERDNKGTLAESVKIAFTVRDGVGRSFQDTFDLDYFAKPGKPQALNIDDAGDGNATITWSFASRNNSKIDHYSIRIEETGQSITVDGETYTWKTSVPSPNTYISVSAHNEAGEGESARGRASNVTFRPAEPRILDVEGEGAIYGRDKIVMNVIWQAVNNGYNADIVYRVCLQEAKGQDNAECHDYTDVNETMETRFERNFDGKDRREFQIAVEARTKKYPEVRTIRAVRFDKRDQPIFSLRRGPERKPPGPQPTGTQAPTTETPHQYAYNGWGFDSRYDYKIRCFAKYQPDGREGASANVDPVNEKIWSASDINLAFSTATPLPLPCRSGDFGYYVKILASRHNKNRFATVGMVGPIESWAKYDNDHPMSTRIDYDRVP